MNEEPTTPGGDIRLVHIDLYRQMEAERDAARARLLEVEAAHKQTIRYATALGEERDKAIRQRDHARSWAAYWRMAWADTPGWPEPAALTEEDDDGWYP